jgi:hypothetical protein
MGIEKEAKALGVKSERARIARALAKRGLDLDQLLATPVASKAAEPAES